MDRVGVNASFPCAGSIPRNDERNYVRDAAGERLSDRGAELLYRHFDCFVSTDMAAVLFDLSIPAVRRRRIAYHAEGGIGRVPLAIESAIRPDVGTHRSDGLDKMRADVEYPRVRDVPRNDMRNFSTDPAGVKMVTARGEELLRRHFDCFISPRMVMGLFGLSEAGVARRRKRYVAEKQDARIPARIDDAAIRTHDIAA